MGQPKTHYNFSLLDSTRRKAPLSKLIYGIIIFLDIFVGACLLFIY